jgi:hypothetical protein
MLGIFAVNKNTGFPTTAFGNDNVRFMDSRLQHSGMTYKGAFGNDIEETFPDP